MEEQLVKLEVARLAKEKGFDWEVMSYYSAPSEYTPELTEYNINDEDELDKRDWNLEDDFPWLFYSAPTQSLLQKWIREEKRLHIDVSYLDEVYGFYYYITDLQFNDEGVASKGYKTYEEALENGILTALKSIK